MGLIQTLKGWRNFVNFGRQAVAVDLFQDHVRVRFVAAESLTSLVAQLAVATIVARTKPVIPLSQD